MRIFALIFLRWLSGFCGLLALIAVGKLAMGVYAIFTVQKEFTGVNPLRLGALHGEFILAPVFLTAVFATLTFVLWRFSSRFRSRPVPNSQFDADASRREST